MILIDSHSHKDLNNLAKNHFRALISPQNKDGSYHASQSIIGRIEKQLKEDISIKYRVKFWEYFLNNHFRNLERVISSRPEELSIVVLEIENLIGHNVLSNNMSYNQASLTSFGTIVKTVFGYENYRDYGSARANVDEFNLNYCPYCNIHKLERIKRTNILTGLPRDSALHQLDHFYSRSRYPYLAVSFFNLIPGCSPCNAHLKLDKDFNVNTHINPFHKSFDYFFKFKLSGIVLSSHKDVELRIDNKEPHDKNSIIDFELIERYNDSNTKIKVFDLFNVLKNKSPKIRRSLRIQITGLFGQASNINLLKSQGVPILDSQISDYEMGKMKRDICKQLGIL